jgi:alpha-tubulin suppressor-like RCC1 family protein
MLQRELSRRESSGDGSNPNPNRGDSKSSSPAPDADATAAPLKEAVDAKEQEEESQNNRNGRKPSTLVASRKYAESQQNLDVELHEGGVGISLPFEEPKAARIEEEGTLDVSERSEHDVLLTKASLEHVDKDNNLVGSLLSSSSIAQQQHQPLTATYSWGTRDGFFRLHGDENEATVDYQHPKAIAADSRLGRSNIISFDVSENHFACATATGGVLVCGNNAEGAVDPSQRDRSKIPRPVHLELLAMTRIIQISCGLDHTAAVTETRSVLTWGSDQDGQLGQRRQQQHLKDRRFRAPAAMVLGGRRAATVACGHRFTLVLTTRMEVYMCGREEITGYSTLDGPPRLPATKPALEALPLVLVAAGHQHAVVVTAHGTAYAWGSNPQGACGRECPNTLTVPVPIKVTPLKLRSIHHQHSPFPNWDVWQVGGPITLAEDVAVVHAACGEKHTVLVTKVGQLLVAGCNEEGQLGLDRTSRKSVYPAECVEHPTAGRFLSAEAGTSHTLLLDESGDVWQMGNGKNGMEKVLSQRSINIISAGGTFNVAIASKDHDSTNKNFTIPSDLEGLLDGLLLEGGNSLAPSELANQTEELFRCPAVMNSLFLDPNEMDGLYSKIITAGIALKVQQQVVSAMEKGMIRGLESIRTARLMYPESVRWLLLYLQCPLFRDEGNDVMFDQRGELTISLCETILGLPFEGYKALLAWATTVYSKERFVPFLVKPLIVQLNQRLEKERTRAVPVIVGVLRWFRNASERTEDDIARAEDFHSSGVAGLPMEALYDDLRRFKAATKSERAVNFFICANTFLLSPGAKRNLLQVENQIAMVKAAQSEGVKFDAVRREFLFQPYFVLAIDREHMLQQTLQVVASSSPGQLRKSLKIVFKGEDGVDAGGVRKEFFQLLVAQLFDVNTGMWSMNFGDGNHAWFNSDCTWNYDGYYLVGVLVGLALYNSVLLDVHFPHAVYRKLLGMPLGLEDMVDEEVRNGLQGLLDYDGDDVEDIFCLTFEVTRMDLGTERRRELKPGGANIPVTSDNREEYVIMYVKWLLVDSVKSQYDEFERGFIRVMEDSSLDLLCPDELELLVVGTPELDFAALEANAGYEGFEKDSPLVKNFWRFVKMAPRDTQLKFLKFCTGSTKAPIGGLGELPFKVQR